MGVVVMPMNYDLSECPGKDDESYNIGDMGFALSISFMNFNKVGYTDMYAHGFMNGPMIIEEEHVEPFGKWLFDNHIFMDTDEDGCKKIVKDFVGARFWRS